jgi:general stress protein 26
MVGRSLQTLKIDAAGDIIFFTAASSHKVDELTQDSEVNIAYADHGKRRYISVRGRARMDRDQATIDELWSPVQKVFFPEGKDDPDLMVLRVRDANYWEATGNFISRAVDFAKGMLDKEPDDLGKQGHLDP